jgi:hypothetical protein
MLPSDELCLSIVMLGRARLGGTALWRRLNSLYYQQNSKKKPIVQGLGLEERKETVDSIHARSASVVTPDTAWAKQQRTDKSGRRKKWKTKIHICRNNDIRPNFIFKQPFARIRSSSTKSHAISFASPWWWWVSSHAIIDACVLWTPPHIQAQATPPFRIPLGMKI